MSKHKRVGFIVIFIACVAVGLIIFYRKSAPGNLTDLAQSATKCPSGVSEKQVNAFLRTEPAGYVTAALGNCLVNADSKNLGIKVLEEAAKIYDRENNQEAAALTRENVVRLKSIPEGDDWIPEAKVIQPGEAKDY
jgi:hypothetical protein